MRLLIEVQATGTTAFLGVCKNEAGEEVCRLSVDASETAGRHTSHSFTKQHYIGEQAKVKIRKAVFDMIDSNMTSKELVFENDPPRTFDDWEQFV